MAGDWIKIKSDLATDLSVFSICRDTGLEIPAVVFRLVKVAAWFRQFGDYGKLSVLDSTIDSYLECDGFAGSLRRVGWLKTENEVSFLSGFCDSGAIRKGLGAKIRSAVLSGAVCAACGDSDDLEIDHIVPISRGGGSDRANLQALCRACNRKKGRKTMEEFAP